MNTAHRAIDRTQRASDAFFQPILIAVQEMPSPETFGHGSLDFGILYRYRRTQHIPERDSHSNQKVF
jgi:hypothetical protein